MSKRAFYVTMWLILASFTSLSIAKADILAIDPMEGTVDTEIVISGSGFGYQKGNVLLGQEKCKVLAWNDIEITCEVNKPQRPGVYVISVFPVNKKKTDEPLMFSYRYFTMRQPELFPGELTEDWPIVTIEGAFFGDKKGEVILASPYGGIGIERARILNWSMGSISFELPEGLAERYLLQVCNKVGAGSAWLNIANGALEPLSEVGFTPPGEFREDAGNGSSGVMFNGEFFIFSVNSSDNVLARTYDTNFNQMSSPFDSFQEKKTYALPKPLVVNDRLFVFINAATATSAGKLMYTVYAYDNVANNFSWSPWKQILDLESPEFLSPAPVYNPELNRIEVYYNKHYWDKGYIRWVSSEDDGATWQETGARGDVDNLTPVGLQNAPGAVYYNHPDYGPSTLLAVKNSHSNDNGIVYVVQDGSVVASIFNFGKFGDEAPSLVDLGDYSIALIYPSDKDDPFIRIGQANIPMIRKMDKVTLEWTDPIQAVEMDEHDEWGYNYFIWQPFGAASCDSSTDGDELKLYLFYGRDFQPFSWVADVHPYFQEWILLPIDDPLFSDLGSCP